MILKGQGKAAGEFLGAMGYIPDQQFNAFNGGSRLLFHDPAYDRQVR